MRYDQTRDCATQTHLLVCLHQVLLQSKVVSDRLTRAEVVRDETEIAAHHTLQLKPLRSQLLRRHDESVTVRPPVSQDEGVSDSGQGCVEEDIK